MTESEIEGDRKECAYIKLRGAVERLGLVLEYRSERNYDVAVAAVARAHASYLMTVADSVNGEQGNIHEGGVKDNRRP
jgi:hypothetical protein